MPPVTRVPGCMFCDASPVLLDGVRTHCQFCNAAGDLPTWFGSGTATQRASVARGLHPTGVKLGVEASMCGACKHLKRKQFSKVYLKCSLGRDTCGPATDIRARWRGCVKFEPVSAAGVAG